MADLAIVSAAVPPPVVKSVVETLAVHAATSAPRVSVTVTEPSWAEVVNAPVATEPRLPLAGALIERVPAVKVKVVVVAAAWAGEVMAAAHARANAPTAAKAARMRFELCIDRSIVHWA